MGKNEALSKQELIGLANYKLIYEKRTGVLEISTYFCHVS